MTTHPKLYVFAADGPAALIALSATVRMKYSGTPTAHGWLGVVYPQSHLCKQCLVQVGLKVISAYNPAPLPTAVISALAQIAPAIAGGDTAWTAATKLSAHLGAGYEWLDPEV